MRLDHPVGLHEACRRLSPTHPDHATLPIQQAFNWSSCLTGIPFDRLYLVVFRSVRRAAADLALLREHDNLAYADALEAGGLLYYFKGEMNERRECLSFCLWESREQAQRAAGGASHAAAMRITAQMYESYRLERYYMMRTAAGEENLVFRRIEEG
jgi:hypothetical protein